MDELKEVLGMEEFTDTEQAEILEIALVALMDSEFLMVVSDNMDLTDDYMCELREKLYLTRGLEG
jgi:hypothetical protein